MTGNPRLSLLPAPRRSFSIGVPRFRDGSIVVPRAFRRLGPVVPRRFAERSIFVAALSIGGHRHSLRLLLPPRPIPRRTDRESGRGFVSRQRRRCASPLIFRSTPTGRNLRCNRDTVTRPRFGKERRPRRARIRAAGCSLLSGSWKQC